MIEKWGPQVKAWEQLVMLLVQLVVGHVLVNQLTRTT